jgi:hypothetical protein
MRLLVVLILLAAPLPAQLTPAQAEADFRAAAKAARKLHATELKEALATLQDAAGTFLDAAEDDAGTASVALFDAVVVFQVDLYFAFLAAQQDVAQAGAEALDLLGGPDDLDGVYPDDFCMGTGGPFDDFVASLQAAQAKTLGKARKLLEKTGGKLAKQGDARLSFFLEPATTEGQRGFGQAVQTGQTREPLVLHTVIALGFESEDNNGLLLVSGMGDAEGDPIVARCIGDGVLMDPAVDFPELGSPFWTVNAGGSGAAEGNYVILAWQGDHGSSQSGYVSVK